MLILFIMCDCANCDEITLFEGTDGNGIVSTSYNSGTGVLTLYYTDGTTYSTTSLIGPTGPAGPTNYAPVLYTNNALGSGTSGTFPTSAVLPSMTYTIPAGGAGTYEVLFVASSEFTFSSTTNNTIGINIFKNGTIVGANNSKAIKMSGVSGESFSIPVTVLASNITGAVGDIITVQSTSTSPTTAYLILGILKINKVA
jgi:hypothetical protein